MGNSNVVYICSDTRSGSTLLDMLLGRHPLVTSVGELHHLYNYLNGTYFRQKVKEDTCACERKFCECPFWSRVIREYNAQNEPEIKFAHTRFTVPDNFIARYFFDFFMATASLSKLKKRMSNNKKDRFNKYAEIADTRFKLYNVINSISNTSYVVDSSKKIAGVKFLLAWQPKYFKAIFLTRDLRAIATSKFKREPGSSLLVMMLQTMLFHIKLFLAVKTVPQKYRMVIRYEDVVTNPTEILKRIFLFLGIDTDSKIDLESYHESHVLGGSPHRLTNKKLKIYTDDRWKENKALSHKFFNKMLVLTYKLFYIKPD